MSYRNRRLLDLAHGIQTCTNCGGWTEGCEPAHSNLPEHGRGQKLKADDCFFAALCFRCHAWLDNRGGYGTDPSGRYEHTKEGKREMFTRAKDITLLRLFEAGKLKVAA